jgi:hypothetical protein
MQAWLQPFQEHCQTNIHSIPIIHILPIRILGRHSNDTHLPANRWRDNQSSFIACSMFNFWLGCPWNFVDTEFRMFFVFPYLSYSVRNSLEFRGISRNSMSLIWTKFLGIPCFFLYRISYISKRDTLNGSRCSDMSRCSSGPCFANTRCNTGLFSVDKSRSRTGAAQAPVV